jgi:von Willebrand factor type A domain.
VLLIRDFPLVSSHPGIEGKLNLMLAVESSADVTDKLFNKLKTTMKKIVSLYTIGPNQTQVTLASLGTEIFTNKPVSQNADSINRAIDDLPRQGGVMTYSQELEKVFGNENRAIPKHIVLITSKNVTTDSSRGLYEGIRDGMKKDSIQFNLVNVVANGDDTKDDDDTPDVLKLWIKVIGENNLPESISKIGDSSVDALGKEFLFCCK